MIRERKDKTGRTPLVFLLYEWDNMGVFVMLCTDFDIRSVAHAK